MGQNGKGSDWRKNFDYFKFWNNYDDIEKSKKKSCAKKVVKLRNGKTRYTF